MSSHSREVVLSPRARQDFVDILRYTGETWGESQLLAYRDKLDKALRQLGRNPDLGHGSQFVPTTHRVYTVGSHVIIYRTDGQTVGVVRILHQRMNPAGHL
ncbi:MAG: type II toxin-antitoxin system RelE/ParE family toxin [Proteobacteria bacterium]|nr:type II toxin-antitoxin system RelE/ParE family toxin [Pseudomonadota bacterium]